ncbi:MAG: hypothetical protein EOO73_03205 [Myxococcales bacterium]|nr:MAG: hypothetical protein EOO73_03205 [Myxococcales bacterium]
MSGSALPLALACGSDDDKKTTLPGDAGAAGSSEAGAPNGGGADSAGGAPSEAGAPAAGGFPGSSGAGAAGEPSAAGSGGAGSGGDEGSGGAPVSECAPTGSVTGLDVASEAIYQGCRGGVARAFFNVDDASGTFECCGVSTSAAELSVAVLGEYDFDGGVRLSFEVPSDAAPGSYGLSLTCPTTSGEQVLAVEINEGQGPVVDSITEQVTPGGVMVIQGEHLATAQVRGVRAKDGRYWQCDVDLESQSDTSITCTFPDDIQLSDDAQDLYFIDVIDDECGAAPNPLPFSVIAT